MSRTDSLNCTPIKNAEVDETVLETGELRLAYPVNIRPWASFLLRRVGGNSVQRSKRKLQLDALGTAVWNLLDGRRTVRQVVDNFSRKHRLHPKEAEAAVTQFIRELGRRGLIGLK